MKYIALKTSDGNNTGKLSLYCRALKVSRQGFYKYLRNRDKPWKYADVAEMIRKLLASDLCYDTGEDFMTQFERNKTALLEIIQKSEKELGALK